MTLVRTDAIVIGGGPAGCAAALGLRRAGASCVLVERRGEAAFRIGETLGPGAGKVLERLGVGESFAAEHHVSSYAIASSWGEEALRIENRLFDARGPGWHLDRARFDGWLLDRASAAGVEVRRPATLRQCVREHDRWRVTLADASEPSVIEAGLLVDATGPAARIARTQGARPLIYDRMVGWSIVLPHQPTADGFLLIEAVRDGWWYSVPIPGGGLLVAFVTGAGADGARVDTPTAWAEQLDATVHIRARCPSGLPTVPPRAWPITSARVDRCTGPGWIAVGDAAATFDPLAAVGVEKALATGADAASAIVAGGDAMDDYTRTMDERFETYLSLRCVHYLAEARWPEAPFWHRRRRQPPEDVDVTLPPDAMLRLSTAVPARVPEEVATLVAAREWTDLRTALVHPTTAHACAARLRSRPGSRAGDRRVITALQTMVECGTLRSA